MWCCVQKEGSSIFGWLCRVRFYLLCQHIKWMGVRFKMKVKLYLHAFRLKVIAKKGKVAIHVHAHNLWISVFVLILSRNDMNQVWRNQSVIYRRKIILAAHLRIVNLIKTRLILLADHLQRVQNPRFRAIGHDKHVFSSKRLQVFRQQIVYRLSQFSQLTGTHNLVVVEHDRRGGE